MNNTYKHVIVIGIDGMGVFNKNTATKRMDEIFADSAVTYSALSMTPTISAQNWGAMLLGATPVTHGLTNSIVGECEYKNTDLPSVFTRIRKAMPDALLASCCNWEPINHGIVEHNIAVKLTTAENDDILTEKIIECVSEKPVFLFVQFDDCDGAGHHYGYGTDGHLARISATDALVGRIYDSYKDAGILDDTLFIVTADHGGIRNGHGGYTDDEKYIFFGARGKNVVKSEVGYLETRDIAAIVLYALGLDIPEYDENGFTSQLPDGLFPEIKGIHRELVMKNYEVENKPTPEIDSINGLYAFFPEDSIKLAMFLDNTLEDATGKCTVTQKGLVKYYSCGVRGSEAEFGSTGYAVVNGLDFSDKSFTVALWIDIDRSISEAPAVLGNKDWWWQNRDENGFILSLRCADTVFNIGSGDDCIEITTPFPEDMESGRLHVTVAVDKENRQLRFYNNFKLIHKAVLDEKFLGDISALPFTVGNDGKGEYNNISHKFIFKLDDVFIFDTAFTAKETERLAAYYGESI